MSAENPLTIDWSPMYRVKVMPEREIFQRWMDYDNVYFDWVQGRFIVSGLPTFKEPLHRVEEEMLSKQDLEEYVSQADGQVTIVYSFERRGFERVGTRPIFYRPDVKPNVQSA